MLNGSISSPAAISHPSMEGRWLGGWDEFKCSRSQPNLHLSTTDPAELSFLLAARLIKLSGLLAAPLPTRAVGRF